ncbi:MAG: hypothetical protein ABI345_04535 [Jatrophihabitans sp.]
MFHSVAATEAEIAAPMPGDDLLPEPDVVMDRAFTVPGPPDGVWPWLVQLGKSRAGWYLPRSVERVLPRRNRALRRIEGRWQHLDVGTVIPDYGRDATFEVAQIDAPHSLVFRSQRGRVGVTWAIALAAEGSGTRVRLRLRLHPVHRQWLATGPGDFFDAATIAGMAAGLRERLTS